MCERPPQSPNLLLIISAITIIKATKAPIFWPMLLHRVEACAAVCRIQSTGPELRCFGDRHRPRARSVPSNTLSHAHGRLSFAALRSSGLSFAIPRGAASTINRDRSSGLLARRFAAFLDQLQLLGRLPSELNVAAPGSSASHLPGSRSDGNDIFLDAQWDDPVDPTRLMLVRSFIPDFDEFICECRIGSCVLQKSTPEP